MRYIPDNPYLSHQRLIVLAGEWITSPSKAEIAVQRSSIPFTTGGSTCEFDHFFFEKYSFPKEKPYLAIALPIGPVTLQTPVCF